jgi:hypothetical protein
MSAGYRFIISGAVAQDKTIWVPLFLKKSIKLNVLSDNESSLGIYLLIDYVLIISNSSMTSVRGFYFIYP